MFGIVRPLDRLGRIVLPMEFRKTMGLKEGTQMEIIGTRAWPNSPPSGR